MTARLTASIPFARTLAAALLLAASAAPGLAQEAAPGDKGGDRSESAAPPAAPRPIRNAPSARALELAAYVFAASNVCGFPVGAPAFEALLARQGVKPEDVALRGPFGNRIVTIFSLMSNDMAKHREQSCLAVAGEYGPQGSVAKDVLLIDGAGTPAEPAPAQPAR